MDSEKYDSKQEAGATLDRDVSTTRTSHIIGEADEIYGYAGESYVHRGLKSRHVQFIALAGAIGTGLFLGIGSAFVKAGPLSVLLGYTITGIFCYGMMSGLGEMATWLPLPGAIPQFVARYCDPALGFTLGWTLWYSSALSICAEISAAAVVIQFWNETVSVAVWITIIGVIIIVLNIFAVSIYGEAEFWFATLKLITLVGLLILALILDLGGGPTHHRLGFQYWKNPGAMKEYLVPGNTGRFLGFFSTLINAGFSYSGMEAVAIAAGETINPRKNIPKAVSRVFWRILFFYVLGTLAIGVLVASNDDRLLSAINNGAAGAARSPWVIAIYNAGIPILPSIINTVILTSASSSGNSGLYGGSRYLFALCQNGHGPKILLKCNKQGLPIYCIGFTAIFISLTYLSVGSGASIVFTWLQNLITIATFFNWCMICLAYTQFYKALKAQGIDRDTLRYKSPFQPYTAWAAFWFFVMVIIFNGFAVFFPGRFNATDFLAAYIGVPLFFIPYIIFKVVKKTKWQNPEDMDIHTGKAAIDALESTWPVIVPNNMFEKIWYWIA